VRHQVPLYAALNDDPLLTDNEEIRKLKELDNLNCYYCQILATNGFDGKPFRITAPKRTTTIAVSKPNTQERRDALKKASTAGQTFHATGGGHLNSDDFFLAAAAKARDHEVKAMEEIKKNRKRYCDDQWAALRLIKAKGELTFETASRFSLAETKTMAKWKKIKPTGTKKSDLVEAYTNAPKPKIKPVWQPSEEAKLDALKDPSNITLQSTALGVAMKKMVRTLQNSFGDLDVDSLKELEALLQAKKEQDNPNAL
jgi:hypothetical protein